MNKFEKYSSYKDSGVEWLGEIPEHWEVKPLKHLLLKIIDNRGRTPIFGNIGIPMLEISNITYGIKSPSNVFSKFVDENIVKHYERDKVKIDDLLISTVGATSGKTVIIKEEPNYFIAQNVVGLRVNINVISDFLFYVLNSSYFYTSLQLINKGNTIDSLKVSIFINNICFIPSKEEQTKIASFLDKKTAQIDEVISQKEKLIELLKERKQIVINDAVTKGLDKNVEFVDSGVEWIGKIPKHWKLERLGSNFIERREKVSDKDFEPLSVTKNGVVPQLDSAAKSNDGDNRKLVRKGDFVINSRSDRKGSSGLSKLDGSVSLINIVLKPIDINSDFSHILLKSNGFIEEFYRNGHGIVADLWTTRFWDMKSIMLAIPPKDEQIKIVEYIENQTSKIDIAIELQQNYISKLKEYKASLIDSVVTGKVKV